MNIDKKRDKYGQQSTKFTPVIYWFTFNELFRIPESIFDSVTVSEMFEFTWISTSQFTLSLQNFFILKFCVRQMSTIKFLYFFAATHGTGVRKYVVWCLICGGISCLLGVMFLGVYFLVRSYTSTVGYFETVPTFVPATLVSESIFCCGESLYLSLSFLTTWRKWVLIVSITLTKTVAHELNSSASIYDHCFTM